MGDFLKGIIAGFGKSPLPTICGLLTGAVVYLWLDGVDMRDRNEAKEVLYRAELLRCANEKIEMQKGFNEKFEDIKRIETAKTEAQIKELEKIIHKIKKR